jgi:hypothetical protein
MPTDFRHWMYLGALEVGVLVVAASVRRAAGR